MGESDNSLKTTTPWLMGKTLTSSKPSKVYIVEFLVMHIALLGVLFSGIGLFNKILDQSADKAQNINIYSVVGIEYTLLLVSFGLVSIVLFILLQARTSNSEQVSTALASSRRRRLLQYIFLTITSLVLIGYIVSFVYSLLLEMFSDGQVGGENLWRVLVKQLFAVGLVGLISYYVAHNVEPRTEVSK
jgi:hypothetical protein